LSTNQGDWDLPSNKILAVGFVLPLQATHRHASGSYSTSSNLGLIHRLFIQNRLALTMAQLIIKDLQYLEVATVGSDSAFLAVQGGLYARASGSAISKFGLFTLSNSSAVARGLRSSNSYTNTITVTVVPTSGKSFSSGIGLAWASAS
jgi:hypothetical protein